MSATRPERRAHRRVPQNQLIELVVDGRAIRAVLQDISPDGLRFRVDPSSFDTLGDGIRAVRLSESDPLAISVIWGLFDGTFGASFNDPATAAPVVAALLRTEPAHTATG